MAMDSEVLEAAGEPAPDATSVPETTSSQEVSSAQGVSADQGASSDHEASGDPVAATDQEAATIPEPTPLTTHGPARVIAMVNQKGGVGKTTSTVSLGAALAGYGRKVLLVDFDPQGALSVALGVNPNEMDRTVYNVLTDYECDIREVVLTTDVENLDLLPSNIDLSAAELQLVSEVGREYALGRALAPLLPDYDIVLIDCQPSLGLLIANGYQYMLSGKYWISFYPGIALLLTIVSINLVGDQLRDVLNPRLKR